MWATSTRQYVDTKFVMSANNVEVGLIDTIVMANYKTYSMSPITGR